VKAAAEVRRVAAMADFIFEKEFMLCIMFMETSHQKLGHEMKRHFIVEVSVHKSV
jgi:hypothetical protein